MMEARAQVLRVEGDQAWLKVMDVGGGCGRCDEPGGCRSVQITQAFGLPKGEFSLPMSTRVAPGDRVLISIPDGAPLRAALASYGLGAVLLLAGAAIGSALGAASDADFNAALGAGLGLLAAFAFNRLLMRSRNWRSQLRMQLAPASACDAARRVSP